MSDRMERARAVLAKAHNKHLGFYAAPEIMPPWTLTAMLAFADAELERVIAIIDLHDGLGMYGEVADDIRDSIRNMKEE